MRIMKLVEISMLGTKTGSQTDVFNGICAAPAGTGLCRPQEWVHRHRRAQKYSLPWMSLCSGGSTTLDLPRVLLHLWHTPDARAQEC